MYSIALIIPYFGRFDNIFTLWLQSCKINNSIDYIIITDIQGDYNLPSNVKFVRSSFSELKNKIQELYDFKISLNTPYRLCNFKPAYGEIFEDLISGYDYWGFCDIDLIWGNIRNFLPSEKNFDKIGSYGHLTLIKNTYDNNRIYRYKHAYKIAFSNDLPLFFDEVTFNNICLKLHLSIFNLKIADLCPRLKNLYIISEKEIGIIRKNIFLWDNTKGLFAISKNKDSFEITEYAYVHFLKRPMINSVVDCNTFFIVPNVIINSFYSYEEVYRRYCKNGLFVSYWKNSLKLCNLKERLIFRIYKNKLVRKLISEMNELVG